MGTTCEDFIPLAKSIAGKAARKTGIDFDELYSDALYGLAKAHANNEHSFLPFNYAAAKIEGAILDGHRARFGDSRPKVRRRVPCEFSLDECFDEGGDSEHLVDSKSTASISRLIDQIDIRDAMESLTKREQVILRLYYEWGLNQEEIGELFDVSEGRISQILTGSRVKLRAAYVAQ